MSNGILCTSFLSPPLFLFIIVVRMSVVVQGLLESVFKEMTIGAGQNNGKIGQGKG